MFYSAVEGRPTEQYNVLLVVNNTFNNTTEQPCYIKFNERSYNLTLSNIAAGIGSRLVYLHIYNTTIFDNTTIFVLPFKTTALISLTLIILLLLRFLLYY